MSSWGNCDFSDLEKLQRQLEEISDNNKLDEFFEECAKELAERLLRKVKNRTPVYDWRKEQGLQKTKSGRLKKVKAVNFTTKNGKNVSFNAKIHHKGGTLRRNWDIGDIVKVGGNYRIQISNPIKYASYVEFGHSTRNRKSWVDGRFMLTISEQEIKKSAPGILEKKLKEYLRRRFND